MGFVAGERTFFRGVRKMLPGTVLTWTAGDRLQTQRYWHLPPPTDTPAGNERQAADQTRALLETAVKSHLLSDVPLGVFLSGGIDSTVLTALVARAATGRVKTFAVGFHEHGANELPYARLAADRLGTEHHEVTLTAAAFVAALPRLVWHEDEPIAFPSSIPLHFVARLASDHVKVVLTGEGADELFLGYNRYRVTALERAPRVSVLESGPARDTSAGPCRCPRPATAAGPNRSTNVPGAGTRHSRLVFRELRGVSVEPATAHAPARSARGRLSVHGRTPLVQRGPRADCSIGICRVDLQTYLLELLMKQDQMSMAASIESRVPFLDDRLVEHVVTMPGHVKLPGWRSKAILRDAVKDLIPPEIMNRPKMGFPSPSTNGSVANSVHLLTSSCSDLVHRREVLSIARRFSDW